ncbi:MAG TPA: CHAT domain-containing protein, partial [Longimicrobium sp.]|nr:CHAT domain-containing protein [Longimicrobium sp.]
MARNSALPAVSRAVLWLAPLLVVGALAAHALGGAGAGGDEPGFLAAMARLDAPRTVAPRLSTGGEYRRCAERVPPGGTVPRADCGPAEWISSDRAISLATRAARAAETTGDLEARRAVALLDLLGNVEVGKRLQGAIASLETAARLADRPAPVLADLAAAYIVRAERTQGVRNLLQAAETAGEAVAAEPGNLAARYNLALALDRIGLDGEAAGAWRGYLRADSTSGWAREARERLRSLKVAVSAPRRPAPGASRAEAAAYATRSPHDARLYGWDVLLGRWGAAILAGDSAAAALHLRLAEEIGAALQARGGDASLADAVRAIRARRGDRAGTLALARAHRAYGDGRAATSRSAHADAGALYDSVLAADPASLPLRLWAGVHRAAALVHTERSPRVVGVLGPVMAGTDTLRYPAIAASAASVHGTALLRTDGFDASRDRYRQAARHYRRAGEREMTGGAELLAADAELALGLHDSVHASMHRALATLRPFRGSIPLHNLLSVWAQAAAADGLGRSAVRLQTEGLAVAEGTGDAVSPVEALVWRAQFLAAAGDTARAEADLRRARALFPSLPADARQWLTGDLRLASATLLVGAHPARAAAGLDSAIALPEVSTVPIRLLQALVGRAEARLALGDHAAAAADLEHATRLLAEQRDEIASAPLRASLLEAGRSVFERMAMLRLRDGREAEALAALEEGRASFSRVQPSGEAPGRGAWRIGPGETALELALVGDTLLAWAVTDTAVRLARRMVGRAALLREIDGALALLASRDVPEPAVRPALAALYDRLVRPVAAHLPRGTRLVVVADGELAGVPFAALHDTASGRYLVEDHVIRFAGSLREASRPARPRAGEDAGALLVADPAFDRNA